TALGARPRRMDRRRGSRAGPDGPMGDGVPDRARRTARNRARRDDRRRAGGLRGVDDPLGPTDLLVPFGPARGVGGTAARAPNGPRTDHGPRSHTFRVPDHLRLPAPWALRRGGVVAVGARPPLHAEAAER